MFCTLVGISPPREDAWDTIQSVKSVRGTRVEWTTRSLAHDEEGRSVLLVTAVCEEPATADELVAAAQDALVEADASSSCELWASCPAPIPLRPVAGYENAIANNDEEPSTKDDTWEDRGAAAMREWGLMLQQDILNSSQIRELRALVDETITMTDSAIERHRPELTIGQDELFFREIASRGSERFDLRLTDSVVGSFVEEHILGHPRVKALLLKTLGSLEEIDFDISVVYSRPGATHQGWHADGDHQKGAKDAGWEEEGWKTHLAYAYAVCLFVPLIDLNDEVGYTQFWPGSHRNRDLHGFGKVAQLAEATFDGKCSAGSGLWYDYRLFHRGMPNRSSVLRPVVQVIFKKQWYVERANYGVEPIAKGSGPQAS